jgi:outer membrane receptor protein involved in Fe transport
MKKIFSVSIMWVLILFSSLAQKGQITGQVIDNTSKKPLDFANVAVYMNASSEPIQAVFSDIEGKFSLKELDFGSYVLRVSFVGYTSFETSVVLSKEKSHARFNRILLKEDSQQISEVQVVGQRSGVSFEIDKKVFNVDETALAQGSSTTDVLKNIPSVAVDTEGNISLRNNSSVEIWINGKPSGLTDENRGQVLEQLPAATVEKIEVITNPSARFNPEGSAGIINVVLKDKSKGSYLASVNTSAGYDESGGIDGSLGGNYMYNGPKFDVQANASLRSGRGQNASYNNRATLLGTDTLSHLNQLSTSESDRLMGFLRAGITYHINPKNDIGISGFGMLGDFGSNNKIDYYSLNAIRDTLEKRNRLTESLNNRMHYNVSIDYKHFFDKNNHELSSSIYYVRGNFDSFNAYNTSRYDANDVYIDNSKTYQEQNAVRNMYFVTWQADYFNKFTKDSKLESGLRYNYRNSLSEDRMYDSIFSTNSFVEDITKYNRFTYVENIYAAYSTYSHKINTFSFQLGLRAEQTITEAKQYYRSYFNLFPSVFLSQSLPNSNELQLNYTRRINRPRGQQLNDFVNRTDELNISYGNPLLRPELTNSFEFNYLKSWEQGHAVSTSLYYRSNTDVIQRVRKLQNEIMESTFENITTSESAGAEFVVKNRLFASKLDLTSTLNAYYYSLAGNEEYNIPSTESFTWNARINANMIIQRGFTSQLTGYYRAAQLEAQGRSEEVYGLDLGLRKTFFKGALSVGLSIRDLLDSQRTTSISWGENFYQESASLYSGRSYRLTATYNFGNMKNGKRQDSNRNNNGFNEENIEF